MLSLLWIPVYTSFLGQLLLTLEAQPRHRKLYAETCRLGKEPRHQLPHSSACVAQVTLFWTQAPTSLSIFLTRPQGLWVAASSWLSDSELHLQPGTWTCAVQSFWTQELRFCTVLDESTTPAEVLRAAQNNLFSTLTALEKPLRKLSLNIWKSSFMR